MVISVSTVSRIKNEGFEACIQFLYHASGLESGSQDHRCIPEVQARAWFDSHRREVEHARERAALC